MINDALEQLKGGFDNLPPNIREFITRVSELAQDEVFIENLRKEILNRYGE